MSLRPELIPRNVKPESMVSIGMVWPPHFSNPVDSCYWKR